MSSNKKRADVGDAAYKAIFDNAFDAILVVAVDGRLLDSNTAASHLLGFSHKELLALNISQLLPPGNDHWLVGFVQQEMAAPVTVIKDQFVCKNGKLMAVEVKASSLKIEGQRVFALFIARASDPNQAESQVVRQKQFSDSLHEMAVGLMHSRNLVDVLDSILHYACRLVAAPNGFVYMESADPNLLEIKVGLGIFEQHVGYKIGKGDGLAGKVWSSGKPIIIENYYQSLEWDKDSQGKGTQTAIGIPLQSQGKVVGVIGLDMFGQARSFSQEDFIAFERLAELASIAVGNAYLAETLDRELEERKETEEQLIYLNNHDAMTGVFNRSFFEIVQSQVEEAGNVPVALFICDVDNLKLINDQYGHQAGDVILKATASILTAIAPPGAVVSRIGGDEFAMIIPGIDKAELIEIRENIRQRTENYSKNESAIPLSMSVGYAIAEKGPISMEQLFQIADDGMYRQKPGQVENIRQVIMNNLVNTKNLPDNTK